MSELKIQPLGTRVVIKTLEGQSQTASGLYIPETAKEKPQTGQVLAVGDSEDVKLKIGEKVLFAKYTGTEFKLDGQDYLLMECSDVLARIHD
jgi:chaperonin GroES